jgi:hypothetical protein
VTVGLKGGKSESVLIGKKKNEEDFYVKRASDPQVFLVKKYAIERINKRPIEFRDKTVCNIGDATLVSVSGPSDSYTLVKDPKKSGDDAWKVTKPAGVTVDPSKAADIAVAFREWKAQSYAEDSSPKTTGLAKPSITITGSGSGKTCVVKVGAELPDKQNRYAQVGSAPEVYVIPKWTVERVAKKVDDLKKKDTSPSASATPPSPH